MKKGILTPLRMFLQIIYIGSITNFLITMFLYWRQFSVIKESKVPNYMLERVSDEDYKKTKHYNIDKMIFSTFTVIIHFIKSFFTIYYGVLPYCYNILNQKLGLKSELLTQIIFLLISTLSETIFGIPFSLYSTFVIEEKYGFNKMTFYVFLTDLIKSTCLIFTILPVITTVVLKMIDYFDTFFLKVTIFLVLFQMIMVVIFPIFIMPLFNKFEEMKEGSLKDKIKELAKKVGFQYSNIFVMDGSKRSGHSNAFFIGLFKEKRIVFYDTLLEQTTEEESIAILAHELGHWHHAHTWRFVFIQFLFQIFSLYFFEIAVKNRNFSISIFGTENVPILLKMIYFNLCSSMIGPLMTLLVNMFSRYHEKQADLFAVSHGFSDDLIKGLISLHKENRAPLSTDWLYSTYYHSHPTLDERISFIAEKKELFEKKIE